MQFISISLLCQYVKKFTKNIFEKCVYFFIFGKTTKYRRKNRRYFTYFCVCFLRFRYASIAGLFGRKISSGKASISKNLRSSTSPS